jgi:hypothetical protein
MGKMGAARVAQQHNAAIEAEKLATLFCSSIQKFQKLSCSDIANRSSR